ncbi:hypothetical protein HELRODRAFT_65985 [Helobdella robusta]|uniref:Ig-like domain-containing protein n=1 Tax=Helobdella robusta TaxID=6412 RepID=T1FYF6_HELRO|nr:hypothetical protein HELRODRAFT_65985 [Helobdella robusta]ESO02395.1 hypothetical protein HELRODRAFT_65985 [Helobdella robusta]
MNDRNNDLKSSSYHNNHNDSHNHNSHHHNVVTASPGDRVGLSCRIDDLGSKTIIWRKVGRNHPLTIGTNSFVAESRFSVIHNSYTNEWLLVIQDVRAMDEGMYVCYINAKNTTGYSVHLDVRSVEVSGTEYIEKGDSLKLKCNATGRPEPPLNLEWYRHGKIVRSDLSRRILVTKKIETRLLTSLLDVENVQLEDEGEYVCISSGNKSASIFVHIINR